jgi:hypothetical protein
MGGGDGDFKPGASIRPSRTQEKKSRTNQLRISCFDSLAVRSRLSLVVKT